MNSLRADSLQPLLVDILNAEAFAPFGEVIEAAGAASVYPINNGTTTRFNDLATVDNAEMGGRTLVSLFRAQPRELPIDITMLERHPLGSQAFVPLDPRLRYLVVVAESPMATPRAFLATNGQGVSYRRGTWHHPLIALQQISDFLVIDRGGAGNNCDEVALEARYRIGGV